MTTPGFLGKGGRGSGNLRRSTNQINRKKWYRSNHQGVCEKKKCSISSPLKIPLTKTAFFFTSILLFMRKSKPILRPHFFFKLDQRLRECRFIILFIRKMTTLFLWQPWFWMETKKKHSCILLSRTKIGVAHTWSRRNLRVVHLYNSTQRIRNGCASITWLFQPLYLQHFVPTPTSVHNGPQRQYISSGNLQRGSNRVYRVQTHDRTVITTAYKW